MQKQFGETSDEAVKAAKRVAELKDRIGDAQKLTAAFDPDRKFQAVATVPFKVYWWLFCTHRRNGTLWRSE
jgi:hypothetical protein